VAKELAGQGEITASQVPAGKKAVYMYKGAYKEMAPVYEAMVKWINDNGQQPTGVVYEFYYNSLMEVPESELVTKIVFLLK
jgi:effector-binding domain-containing protein